MVPLLDKYLSKRWPVNSVLNHYSMSSGWRMMVLNNVIRSCYKRWRHRWQIRIRSQSHPYSLRWISQSIMHTSLITLNFGYGVTRWGLKFCFSDIVLLLKRIIEVLLLIFSHLPCSNRLKVPLISWGTGSQRRNRPSLDLLGWAQRIFILIPILVIESRPVSISGASGTRCILIHPETALKFHLWLTGLRPVATARLTPQWLFSGASLRRQAVFIFLSGFPVQSLCTCWLIHLCFVSF